MFCCTVAWSQTWKLYITEIRVFSPHRDSHVHGYGNMSGLATFSLSIHFRCPSVYCQWRAVSVRAASVACSTCECCISGVLHLWVLHQWRAAAVRAASVACSICNELHQWRAAFEPSVTVCYNSPVENILWIYGTWRLWKPVVARCLEPVHM